MDLAAALQTLGISLGLGLLVGIQRERVNSPLAGVRTFALITLFGTLCGMIAQAAGPWVIAGGLLGVASAVVVGNLASIKAERDDLGITTEIAILLMYAIGVYLVFGHKPIAVVLGGSVAVLLYAKPIMHRFVSRLGENDMRAMMQFVLISLVILPVLPNRAYGPYGALNPREIWWMVVLVVGISLAGYVALKLVRDRAGILLGGLIGGLISSTATTVSYARRAAHGRGQSAATLAILLATTVVYARVLVEIWVVASGEAVRLAPPIAVILAFSIVLCLALWWKHRDLEAELPEPGNPTELKPALLFAALFAFVQLALGAARQFFGDRGIFVAAGLSGLTDMDAITLSAGRLAATGGVTSSTAWRAILVASIANLVFKAAIVTGIGGPRLARPVGILFALEIAASILLLAFWPS